MITGASWKPFAAVRSPVVPLNENVPPGAISVPSISLRDELHVVEPPGRAAVGRRVGGDDALDPHRLRDLVVRCGSRDPHDEVRRPLVGRERGGGDRLRGRRDVELEAGLRRPDHDLPRRRDLEVRVLRLARDGRREPLEVLARRRARRSRPSCCRPRAARAAERSASAARASASRRRRAAAAPRARCAPASRRRSRSAPLTFGSVVCDRQRDGHAAVEARRARRRPSPRPRSRSSSRPGHALDDLHVEALADEPGVDALAVDHVGDLGELVADGRVVGLDRRRDVDAEEPRPQALEAAQRARSRRPRPQRPRRPRASRPRRRAARPSARTAGRRP